MAKVRTHLVIPDCQVRVDTPTNHLAACGKLIADRRPDVIVQLGDFADMYSLNSYDRGTKGYEGARYAKDVQASRGAMETLLKPLNKINSKGTRGRGRRYRPRMVLTLGNHEHRITRAISNDANHLDGVISIDDLGYKDYGWEVHPFLRPVNVDGINYVHYCQSEFSPTAIGRAHLIAAKRHASHTVGHKQTLDYYVDDQYDVAGIQVLMCGSFYLHDEGYKGEQTNNHWRGVILKHVYEDGRYDPEFIHIDRLMGQYG